MKIYLAGPISGLSYNEVVSRYTAAKITLEAAGYTVYHPMTGKTHLRNELEFKAKNYNNSPISTNHAIIERDHWMVDQVDMVLADLTNGVSRVSIGTCFELAWAAAQGKHTIVVMQENNIHQHAFVIEAADIIFETLEEATSYLIELAGLNK
jgi:nucleoside 2-deoxyribosyltransferase